MNTVAIIPARGGSKGVAEKNVRIIAGKPLIQHSIEHALHSTRVQRVYVTTDDAVIAKVARDTGAEVISRPAELASDTATSESALLHALESILETSGALPDKTVFLQCTSPIRDREDIDNAIAHFEAERADSLLSVVETHRFLWRVENGCVTPVNYNPLERPRRQDMTPGFIENGSLYVFDTRGFMKMRNRLFGTIAAYRMCAESAYEIDDELDIVVVSALMSYIQGREKKA